MQCVCVHVAVRGKEEYKAGDGEVSDEGDVGGVDESDSNLWRSSITDEPLDDVTSCVVCGGFSLLLAKGIALSVFVEDDVIAMDGSITCTSFGASGGA